MKNKKGQLGSLPGIITTFFIVALFIGIGFIVVQEFRDHDALSDTSGSVTNETGLFLNETTDTLAKATAVEFNGVSVSAVWADDNQSNCTQLGAERTPTGYSRLVESANYSVYSDGVIENATTCVFPNVTFTYTYNYGESSLLGANDTLVALQTFPDLFGLLILIALIGIVLAIVFNVMPGGRGVGA